MSLVEASEIVKKEKANFERGLSTTDKGFPIKGGISRNPYAQLMRQRGWPKEMLSRYCFHETRVFATV